MTMQEIGGELYKGTARGIGEQLVKIICSDTDRSTTTLAEGGSSPRHWGITVGNRQVDWKNFQKCS